MSEENKALVRRATDAGNDEGSAAVDRFYAADWIGWDSRDGSKSNRDDMKKELEVVLSGFPDARVTIEDLIAEGDKVASRLTHRHTHEGFGDLRCTDRQANQDRDDGYRSDRQRKNRGELVGE
jgi:predicted ester cyclase